MSLRFLFVNQFRRQLAFPVAAFVSEAIVFTLPGVIHGLIFAVIMYLVSLLFIFLTTKDYKVKDVSLYDAIALCAIFFAAYHIGAIACIGAALVALGGWYYANAKHPEWF